jgi:ADP-ribose pyrophosphatase YjhB (NUDIX family)
VTWKPHVTVAAVIERDGHFLLVEEESEGARVYNQPAGHWERGETLSEACSRETLEESAWRFEPAGLVGIYSWQSAAGTAYLRFAYHGNLGAHEPQRQLDSPILRALWLTVEEIRGLAGSHRSPLVMRCVEDYLAGRRYPFDIVTHWQ